MEKDKNVLLKIEDNVSFCFNDSVEKVNNGNRKPQGYVKIYEVTDDGNKQLVGKSNLVVNFGREWLLSRAFNIKNQNITQNNEEFICWLGLGTGGAVSGDPFDPISPTNLDTGLVSECPVSATDINCGDFRSSNYYKLPFDSLTFTQDPDNNNSYLIMEIVTTIGANYANGYSINEAGLFTNLTSAGGAVSPFSLYSRVTFPTIMKTSSRQIVFVWYIYF